MMRKCTLQITSKPYQIPQLIWWRLNGDNNDKTTSKLPKFRFNNLDAFTREKAAELTAYPHHRENFLTT